MIPDSPCKTVMVENKKERWKKKIRRIEEEVLLKREPTPKTQPCSCIYRVVKKLHSGCKFSFQFL